MSDNDTIYRQEAIDALNTRARDTFTLADGYSFYVGALHDVADDICKLPSAQPEIIRCKDCKHYQFADNRAFGMPVKMCKWFGFEDVDDDDFCSRAERRTDE